MYIFKLIRQFRAATGRSPTPNELSKLKKQAETIVEQEKIIQFPNKMEFPPKKSLKEFKASEDAFESSKLRGNETFDELIDPTRIKGGISTRIKLNSFRENEQYAKDLIGGKSKEFNTLKSKDRKEVLDQLEAQIKKGKTPPTSTDDMPFAMGGLAGLLGEGARVDLALGGGSSRNESQESSSPGSSGPGGSDTMGSFAYGGRTGFKKGSKKSLGSRAKELLLGNPDAIKYFGGIDVVDQMYQLLGLPGLYASGGRIGYAEGTPKTEKILAAEKMAREKNITVEQALQKIFEDANTEGRSKMAKGGLAELLGE